ncbi:hypothetical protein CDG76_30290 [Nostoc sp. 'Peltigera membranacea cyanobiont' 210A]|uniref:HEAT repeat domain-containing protein n=1 Tax=Nostoc sp. 'Peltigera membranacea cyanobiont' 210A TaxID=2014529 RepID=UPI000B95B590|nr:HEAT repeat domain-containing protein [Nostoc sp. 'Peltigera membranacea cyanobiont' 210A]OYD90521.1 hypothetical protein CDG76_30290 [Nostoc sp. 'Peltigera membranacea cyanobiont' 210A]
MQPLQPVSGSDLQRFLSAPEELLQQSVALQLAVASFHQTPRSLLEILVNSPDAQVAEAASLHVNLAGEITDGWQQAVDEILQQRQLGQNDRLAVELLKIGTVPPCFFSQWVPAEPLIQGLRNPQMPLRYRLQLLQRLSQEPTLEPRLQVAESPETPSAVLEQLAGDLELPVRLAVKFNPSCPPPLIELVEGQYAVASDWNTDSEQLAILGQSRWAWVRLAVAQNPSATAETLMQLAGNAVYKIQLAISQNPFTPTEALNLLANYVDKETQNEISIALAKHPNTSEQVLLKLYPKHKHTIITQRKNLPLSIIEQLVRDRSDKNFYYYVNLVINQSNISGEILEVLADDSLESMRVKIAKHPQMLIAKEYKQMILGCYRLLLSKEKTQEITIAHQLMAQRPDSSYALAQVLEKGDQKAKLIAARSNKTPIQVLQQLAKDTDETVRSVVSENSNLPLSSLLELTQDSSLKVRSGLARKRSHKKTPVQVLERLANDESAQVRAQVAANLDTPVELLKMLANDQKSEVWRALTRNPNTPMDVLEFLGVEKGIVSIWNTNTPGNALAKAVEQTLKMDYSSRYKALDDLLRPATGSQMPASVLVQLASRETSWIRSLVAGHPNTPISALEPLLNDDYGPVLWAIARRADTPPQLLERLLLTVTDPKSQDYEQISLAICDRREIPPNLLEPLMQSNLQQVYQRVAAQPNLPQAIVERLMAVSNDLVLITLAGNQSLTAKFLNRLAENPNPKVCSAIVNHLNMTPELWLQLANHTEVSVRQVTAAYSNTPVNILEILARDSDKDVRVKVAANTNSPVNILEQLARDQDASVRTATASNSHLPATVLTQLANDEKVEVCRAVAQNPNTPAPIRESLRDLIVQPTTRQTSPTLRGLNRLYNPSTDDLVSILAEYASSENAFVRLVTLLHPLTPHEVLTQGAQSASWLERYAVADNSGTPSVLRQQLAEDSNRIVRAAARVNTNS